MMEKSLSVLEAGAVPGDSGLQTAAFQQAIDRAYLNGGGRVTVPAGKYYIGGIRLRSHVTLYLCAGAELYGSRDPEDYHILDDDAIEPLPEEYQTDKLYEPFVKGKQRDYSFLLPSGRWNNAVIRAIDAQDIAVIGEEGAVIDGCDCFDELGEEKYRGPHGISLHHCKNVRLSGYTIRNTGNWAHCIFDSEGIVYSHVTVLAGHDGIHLTGCRNAVIENSEFYTGDDCVAGFADVNILIKDCVLNTACSGMRFGGTNVLAERCRFFGPARHFFRGSLTAEEKRNGAQPTGEHHRTNMLSVLTYYADFSVEIPEQPENMILRDCTAENVDRFLHYNFSGNEKWQANRPLRNLCVENVWAEGIVMPVTAYGSAELPFSLTMRNVSLSFAPGYEKMPAFWIANCERILLDRVTVRNRSEAPLIVSWSRERTLQTVDLDSDTLPDQQQVYTEEPFICKPI